MITNLKRKIVGFAICLIEKRAGSLKYQRFFQRLYQLSLQGMNFGNDVLTTNGEVNVLHYIATQADGSPCIFDVGANIGDYTLNLINAFGNSAELHSFEPSPTTFDRLCQNLTTHPYVNLHNLGLSNEADTITLYKVGGEEKDLSGLSSVFRRNLDHINVSMDIQEEIKVERLDSFCKTHNIQHIHFLKLDVEGNELNILNGAASWLESTKIDFIQFEFGGCNIDSKTYFRDFFSLLSPNYSIYRVVQDGLVLIEKYSESSEVFTTINYLAISRKIQDPAPFIKTTG
jgi:FkbM family methyltransferase